MTPQEIEAKLREDEVALQRAIAAYNAVFQSWRDLDAHTIDACRRTAVAAAIGAAKEIQSQT
jgi:hypothetical protein